MSGTAAARVRYVPLDGHHPRRRQGGEYAARRALFLQSYRFSEEQQQQQEEEVRLVRRLRAAVARAGAGLARAWRGWRPRALTDPLLGCFGSGRHEYKYYLHGYA